MAIIGVLKEPQGESRVAATPNSVKALIKKGCEVVIEAGAGASAFISDEEYRKAGAKIEKPAKVFSSDIILAVNASQAKGKKHPFQAMKKGAIWISFFLPQLEEKSLALAKEKGIGIFSMNLIPRISRAQSMDALTSQSTVAGYKAVLLATSHLPRMFPLMMTASGTIRPAKVVILGAGVAGLQAIATARRLGAQVEASDVRQAAKEQVESLGAKFIEVPNAENLEDTGGYAKEASKEFLQKQSEEVAKHIAQADVVIATALVPGKKAPILVTKAMVESMKNGSVIVDLAAQMGGNCELTKPGDTLNHNGITIIGHTNIAGTVAADASEMYAQNLVNFLNGMLKEGKIEINPEDEVYKAAKVSP